MPKGKTFDIKKIIKIIFVLAVLYLMFVLGLKLIANQGVIIDRFAMNQNQFHWIERTGVWLVAILPLVVGIMGLIFIAIQIYFPERSYVFYKKGFACLFVISTIICVFIAAKVYNNHVLLKTGVSLQHYEMNSDGEEYTDRLNLILDQYSIKQVPALLIFKDGVIVEYFEGLDIVNGIISYADMTN